MIGIFGASGIIYGVRKLEVLRNIANVEIHFVLSESGILTAGYELDQTAKDIKTLADVVYAPENIGASISSRSFPAHGMVVAPCFIKTIFEIAYSITSSLLTRVADVMLKKGRKLVLMIRETPLHVGHTWERSPNLQRWGL